jgi:UDP-glucuronate decarboxylase
MVAPMVAPSSIIQADLDALAADLEPALRPLSGGSLLVSGGSGFLCSYFLDVVARLNDTAWERPCHMICVDNLRSGMAERIAHLLPRPDFSFLEHDISRALDLKREIHWLIHGASIASPVFYRRYPLETIAANVDGTRHMLDLARRLNVKAMLFLSSSEIYGSPPAEWIPTPETYHGLVSSTGPRACYDESKRLAETLCMTYYRLHRVPLKIVRPFNVYGPGQRLDDGRIIPDLMANAVRRDPLVLYSDGLATRSFCYVSDAIKAMWTVLLSKYDGEVFNVGNDREEMTILEVAQCLREVAGTPGLEILRRDSSDAEYLKDNPQRRCPDLTKLRALLAWDPSVSLKLGLTRTLAHYRESARRSPAS